MLSLEGTVSQETAQSPQRGRSQVCRGGVGADQEHYLVIGFVTRVPGWRSVGSSQRLVVITAGV